MPDRREELVRKMVAEGTSDDDIRATLKAFDAQPPVAPQGGMLQTAKDVGIGIAKGAGATVAGLGELAANAGMLPGVRPSAFNADMRNPAFQRAEQATTATNTPQMIGKGLETVAELALPAGAGARAAMEAIPSAARAGGKFQSVMGAARAIPIDVEAPGQIGLRIMDVAERGGGSLPQPVRQFVNWATSPSKEPMTYEIARDFASGISRLSANEMGRLSPAVAREVAGLRVALNKAVGDAAGKVGKGRDYAQAMTEYAKAKRVQNAIDDVLQGAKSALPKAIGGGAAGAGAAGGWWLTKHLSSLLGGD